jgi:hypothetical protein
MFLEFDSTHDRVFGKNILTKKIFFCHSGPSSTTPEPPEGSHIRSPS